jgi:integrase
MAPRKFMNEVRFAMRSAQLSYRTEQSYCAVIRRFIQFHGRRHPAELGATEVTMYLTALAEEQHVSASTQHVALCALSFLYRVILAQPLPLDLVFVRAAPSTRLPVVFTRAEIRAIFAHLQPPYLLMAQLLYGSGLRLMECLRLRVKDVDLAQRQITVRLGKGRKDRITLLPDSCSGGLRQQLAHSRRLHGLDLAEGYGAVKLLDALERKYPRAVCLGLAVCVSGGATVARSTERGHSAAPCAGGYSSANDAAGDRPGRDCQAWQLPYTPALVCDALD